MGDRVAAMVSGSTERATTGAGMPKSKIAALCHYLKDLHQIYFQLTTLVEFWGALLSPVYPADVDCSGSYGDAARFPTQHSVLLSYLRISILAKATALTRYPDSVSALRDIIPENFPRVSCRPISDQRHRNFPNRDTQLQASQYHVCLIIMKL